MKDMCIWGFGYGSGYDEATKNKVNELVSVMDIDVITTGRTKKFFEYKKNKMIFRRSFVGIALFLIYSFIALPLRYNVIIIISKPNNPLLFAWTLVARNKVVHIFSNEYIQEGLSEYPFYFKHIFNHVKYVGVTCIREKNRLDKQLNMNDRKKVILFLPFVNSSKYSYCRPPSNKIFTICFASAPMSESAFDSKGIDIMLQGFKKFANIVDAKLVIVWRRDKYTGLLYKMEKLLGKYCLQHNVEIINNDIANMRDIYAETHTTILVNKNHYDTPNYPQSLLEALSVGRPVITSKINEIENIILQENVGSICELNGESICDAMIDCYKNYSTKQPCCRYVAKKYFNLEDRIKSNLLCYEPHQRLRH